MKTTVSKKFHGDISKKWLIASITLLMSITTTPTLSEPLGELAYEGRISINEDGTVSAISDNKLFANGSKHKLMGVFISNPKQLNATISDELFTCGINGIIKVIGREKIYLISCKNIKSNIDLKEIIINHKFGMIDCSIHNAHNRGCK